MKVFLTIIFTLTTIVDARAQKPGDSLQYYSSAIHDTSSLNLLINYCFRQIDDIPDLSFSYSQKALLKSRELGAKSCEARSITNLGAVEANRGNYPAALKYYMESLSIWELLNNSRGILLSKNNIAQVYGYLKSPVLEYQFLKEAEAIALKDQMEEELGIVKTNLSIFYANTANFRAALNEQLAALAINLKFNKLSLVSLGYSNAGAYLFYLHKIDSAILFYRQSKELGEKINDKKAIALSWSNLAEAFATKGISDTAIIYYEKAIMVSKQIGLKEILSFSYEQLAEIYKNKHEFDKALQFTVLKQSIKDSILNATATKQLAEMQTKYETAKKEQKIQQQQFEITKKNYWIAGTMSFVLLAGLMGYSFYRSNKLKQAQKMQVEIIHQQDMATTAVIKAEENERKRIAGDLHDGIGQTMSAAKLNLSGIKNRLDFKDDNDKVTFEKIEYLIDESCKEVRSISHNMMPNTLLKNGLSSAVKEFIDKIDSRVLKVNVYSEGLNEKIESNAETVLYRVIQESVNNVIKHAGATMLDITLIKDGDNISATIEDDGKGFNMTDIKNKEGIGLKNIQSRIAFLKGTVEWEAQIGKGTVVVINIPA